MKLSVLSFAFTFYLATIALSQSQFSEFMSGPIGGIAIDAGESLFGSLFDLIFGNEDALLDKIIEQVHQIQDHLNEIEDKENLILAQINHINLEIQKRIIDEELKDALSIIDSLYHDLIFYSRAVGENVYSDSFTIRQNEARMLSESIRRDIHSAIERINFSVFDYLNTFLADLLDQKTNAFQVHLNLGYAINKFNQAYVKARRLLSFARKNFIYLEGAYNNTLLYQGNLRVWQLDNKMTSWSHALNNILGEGHTVNPWTNIRISNYTACFTEYGVTPNPSANRRIGLASVDSKGSCSHLMTSVKLYSDEGFDIVDNPMIKIHMMLPNGNIGWLCLEGNLLKVDMAPLDHSDCRWYPFFARNTIYSSMNDQLNYMYFASKKSISSGDYQVIDMDNKELAVLNPLSNSSFTQLFTLVPAPGLEKQIFTGWAVIQFYEGTNLCLSNDEATSEIRLKYSENATYSIDNSIADADQWLFYPVGGNRYILINRYSNNALSTRDGKLWLTPLLPKNSSGFYSRKQDDVWVHQEWWALGLPSDPDAEFGDDWRDKSIILAQKYSDGKNNGSITINSGHNGTLNLDIKQFPSTRVSFQPTSPKKMAQRFHYLGSSRYLNFTSSPTLNHRIEPWANGSFALNRTLPANNSVSATKKGKYHDPSHDWQFIQKTQDKSVFWITFDNGQTCMTKGANAVNLAACTSSNTNQLWNISPRGDYNGLAWMISTNLTTSTKLYWEFTPGQNLKLVSDSSVTQSKLFRILAMYGE